jgi:xylose isomerase
MTYSPIVEGSNIFRFPKENPRIPTQELEIELEQAEMSALEKSDVLVQDLYQDIIDFLSSHGVDVGPEGEFTQEENAYYQVMSSMIRHYMGVKHVLQPLIGLLTRKTRKGEIVLDDQMIKSFVDYVNTKPSYA